MFENPDNSSQEEHSPTPIKTSLLDKLKGVSFGTAISTPDGQELIEQKYIDIIYRVLLPLSLVAMVISSFWFGLSGDEPYANGMGKAAWKFITSLGKDRSVFYMPDNVNRDGVLVYYGNFFDIVCLWLNKISPFGEYTTRHIANAFVGWVGIYYAARLTKRYASKSAAIICILLMFFFPFYFGHAMNNPKDVPMAAFYIMGIFYALRFFDRYDQLSWRDYAWLIFSIILAIDVRVSGLLLIVYLPIIALMHLPALKALAKKTSWVKVILPILIVSVLGYFGSAIFWPYAAIDPVYNPINALNFLSDFRVSLTQLWAGQNLYSMELPRLYLFIAIFITSPWVFIFGLALSIVSIYDLVKSNKNWKLFVFIAFTALFPLLYIIFKGSNVYHLWRHVLFVFPSLAILASIGFTSLGKLKKNNIHLGWVLFLLLLLEPIVFTLRTFPDNASYFNSSVGGTEGAYGNYEMDFYYNGLKPCVEFFKEVVYPQVAKTGDTIILGTNAVHLLQAYLGDDYPHAKLKYVKYYEKNSDYWDFAIFHIALIESIELKERLYGNYNGPIFINYLNSLPICALYQRPSYADLKFQEAINNKDLKAAVIYLQEYLNKDPDNPLLNMVKNQMRELVEEGYKKIEEAPE